MNFSTTEEFFDENKIVPPSLNINARPRQFRLRLCCLPQVSIKLVNKLVFKILDCIYQKVELSIHRQSKKMAVYIHLHKIPCIFKEQYS